MILISLFGKIFFESFKLFVACKVDFVCCNNLRTLCKLGVKLFKLLVDDFKILNGVSAFASCGINDMNKQTASVNMTEELVTETYSVARTFDKTGNIRHNE